MYCDVVVGQFYYLFDEVLFGVFWVFEYYYVVVFWFVQWDDFGVGYWQMQFVGEFVDQNKIMNFEGW